MQASEFVALRGAKAVGGSNGRRVWRLLEQVIIMIN